MGPVQILPENGQKVSVKPVKVDDADQSPEKDAEAETVRLQDKTPRDQYCKQDPVRDLKPFLQGVFFCAVHFSHP